MEQYRDQFTHQEEEIQGGMQQDENLSTRDDYQAQHTVDETETESEDQYYEDDYTAQVDPYANLVMIYGDGANDGEDYEVEDPGGTTTPY